MEGILVFIAIVVISGVFDWLKKRSSAADMEEIQNIPPAIPDADHGYSDYTTEIELEETAPQLRPQISAETDSVLSQNEKKTDKSENSPFLDYEQRFTQKPLIEKSRPQKPSDAINKEEKNENLWGNDYAIQSNEDARKAIIWSEIFRRKY